MDLGLRSFQKLFQMTKIINSQHTMPELLQAFVDAIAEEITQADLVGFFLKQPDGTFQGYTGNKLPADIRELVIDPTEDQFVRDILRKQASEYIPDTSVDLRLDQMKRQLLQIKSILGYPVIVDNEVFGLVFVHDFGKHMHITQGQLDMTDAFLNMASVAISNMRLYEQHQILVKKQQRLLDEMEAVSDSSSVQEVLHALRSIITSTEG